MDDPCIYKANAQESKDVVQRNNLLANCRAENSMDVGLQDINLQSVMQDQQVMLLSTEFDNFMMQNRDFWYQVYLMLGELKAVAKDLSKK